MQLTSLSLALTRAGFLSFSPASLFAAGEPGVWYEPSLTNGTCFQDSSGTTPVTAVEQPVGLILDKSKGLVLGPELFSGFTSTGTWTVSGSTYSISAPATQQDLRVDYVGTSGKRYLISFTASGVSGGVIFYPLSTSPPNVVNGQNTIRQLSDAGIFIIRAAAGASATISNISVRELPGNHAYQTTSTSRPVLSARVNAIINSEQIATAGTWVKEGVASAVFSEVSPPPGFTNYSVIMENTANSVHRIYQNVGSAGTSAGSNTVTAIVKSTTCQYVGLNFSTPDGYMAVFDIFNGALISITATGAAVPGTAAGSIEPLGGGWFQIQLSGVASAGYTGIRMYDPTGVTSTYTGTGRSLSVAGMDFRKTNTGGNLPAYQRVNTATDYDAGAAFPKYLRFDGVDDWLVTNTITPGTDKAQVFAGVRKLSDAAASILAELSATVASNQGAFYISAPESILGTGNYGAISRGSINSGVAALAKSATILAPITSVISTNYDISGDLTYIRVNGAASGNNAVGDQGTGNFLAYPLYIGRRGGTTLPFNGHLYSLIVRFGANLPAETIASTEGWVNGKTGAY